MTPSPAQPTSASYPLSALYLFPLYATRAAYLAATGVQAPPFNAALPVKNWFDPSPSWPSYNVFDASSPSTGYVIQLPVPFAAAIAVNLPGAYVYPPFVEATTGTTMAGPYGSTPVLPNSLCLKADAETIAAEISPIIGKTVTVADGSFVGLFQTVYPAGEQRRQWILQAGTLSLGYAENWIRAQNANGVGAPGHFIYGPQVGDVAAGNQLQWIADAQVTAAPANAVTLPAPMRALYPDEQIVSTPSPDPLFGQPTWAVENTSFVQEITLAEIEALVIAYDAQPGVTAVKVS